MVAITIRAGVVGVIERIHDPVFDQRSGAVVAEFVAACLRVIAAINGESPQVAGVVPSDLQADLRIVFLARSRVDVGAVQRFDIHESHDFQRSDAVGRAISVVTARLGSLTSGLLSADGRAISVVTARLVTVKASRTDRGVASTFLGASAEKHTYSVLIDFTGRCGAGRTISLTPEPTQRR